MKKKMNDITFLEAERVLTPVSLEEETASIDLPLSVASE